MRAKQVEVFPLIPAPAGAFLPALHPNWSGLGANFGTYDI
jgi:hypothetical protein